MTDDEIKILNYVAAGLGGPESIVLRLRQTFHSLIERGFIKPLVIYELSDAGKAVIDPALPNGERQCP